MSTEDSYVGMSVMVKIPDSLELHKQDGAFQTAQEELLSRARAYIPRVDWAPEDQYIHDVIKGIDPKFLMPRLEGSEDGERCGMMGCLIDAYWRPGTGIMQPARAVEVSLREQFVDGLLNGMHTDLRIALLQAAYVQRKEGLIDAVELSTEHLEFGILAECQRRLDNIDQWFKEQVKLVMQRRF